MLTFLPPFWLNKVCRLKHKVCSCQRDHKDTQANFYCTRGLSHLQMKFQKSCNEESPELIWQPKVKVLKFEF